VLALVIRQGMLPVVFGLTFGLLASLVLGRAIRGLLFEVQAYDPQVMAGVAIVLLALGILAYLVPAHRAAGTDVLAAPRFE
jgi:hypothetical protein